MNEGTQHIDLSLDDEKSPHRIDPQLEGSDITRTLRVVDDASNHKPSGQLFRKYRAIAAVNVLRLKVNLGHQGAIAIGLSYLQSHLTCDKTIIMGCDGEDRPWPCIISIPSECFCRLQTGLFCGKKCRR